MEDLIFTVAGVATGVFSGALGVGGALLATPLIRFLGVAPYLAVGTTVPVMLPTTLVGALTYGRQNFVDMRVAILTAIPAAIAAVAGARSTRAVNGHVLMLVTAAIIVILAIRMIPKKGGEEVVDRPPPSIGGLTILGLSAGFLSGLLGIGGGFLMVPVYIKVFGLSTKKALGTSLAVIALIVIPNTVAQAFVGNIDWTVAFWLALGVIPGAWVGARLAIRTRESILRIILVVAILFVAVLYATIEINELMA